MPAAGFIHIALADLIPRPNRDRCLRNAIGRIIPIPAGIGTSIVLHPEH